MWNFLFGSIELFSNHKDFSLSVDTTRNLWLLLHFKDLKIKSKTLIYQVNNGHRQRKSTVHPYRKMQKKHKNTAELLDYLSTKSYDIHKLEIEFTNGWKIKQKPFVKFYFYTNSASERNELIDRLLFISSQGPIDVSKLEPNFSYSFKGHSKLVKIDLDGLPSPDEFWPEERKETWKKAYIAKHYKEEMQEKHREDKENSFISTMKTSLDSTSIESDKVPW
ncbi:hypothetical protein N9C25_00195 [Saprospiraceae bacterium]|nr:hypothetical protein [Saprospiraceae bacterium]